MPVGLYSLDDGGRVQFSADETTFCLSFVGKATVTATINHPAGSGANLKYVDITYVGSEPIIAWKNGDANQRCCVLSTTRSGSTWTFRVLVINGSAGSFAFTYYIFDRPVPVAHSSGGIEVYGPGGAIVFSSDKPLFRAVSQVPYYFGSPSGSVSLPAGDYAITMSGMIETQDDIDVGEGGEITERRTYRAMGAKVRSDYAEYVQVTTNIVFGLSGVPAPGGGLNGYGGQSGALVIDVAGL